MGKHLFLLGVLGLSALALHGCATGMMGKGNTRPTNVEIQLISQSCFQGEIIPCG